jgi:transposase
MGQFVSFPFLQKEFAELRYLVSARDSVCRLRAGATTRLKSVLQVVFPEYEKLFQKVCGPTSRALLRAFPGPGDLRAAPKRQVLKVLRDASRNHLGERQYERLMKAAQETVALPAAQESLKAEVLLLIEQVDLYGQQMKVLEEKMAAVLEALPEGKCLLTIPGVERFEAMLERNGGRKLPAIVALSRDLLRLMFNIAKEQREFTAEPPVHEKKGAMIAV